MIRTKEDLSAMMQRDLPPFGTEFDYLTTVLEDAIMVKGDLDYAYELICEWDEECKDLLRRLMIERSATLEMDETINKLFAR